MYLNIIRYQAKPVSESANNDKLLIHSAFLSNVAKDYLAVVDEILEENK